MKLGVQVGLGHGHIVLGGDPAPSALKGHSPPIFGPYLLRPNGCLDQGVTWYGARPRPRRLWVRCGPRSPSAKGGGAPSKFLAHIYCSHGWMDEAGTWHGGRPQPRRLCVRWGVGDWGPRSPLLQIGTDPQFLAHICCGQMAAWIKMSLGMELGIDPAATLC